MSMKKAASPCGLMALIDGVMHDVHEADLLGWLKGFAWLVISRVFYLLAYGMGHIY